MTVHTTLPGVQFYAGNFIGGCPAGKGGAAYGDRHGFCLETQFYPDSPNRPGFPSCVLKAGEEYHSTTIFSFSHLDSPGRAESALTDEYPQTARASLCGLPKERRNTMTANEKKALMVNACKVRMGVIESTHAAKAGHPGGSLSSAELFTYLYFKELNRGPQGPAEVGQGPVCALQGPRRPGALLHPGHEGLL